MKYYSHKYKQLDLGLFRSSLSELDKSNRWVVLGDTLPWTELEKEYNSRLQNDTKGAGNKPARMIIGAMMIKHRLNLSDVETIEMIRENPYMQYMCGLSEFTDKPIFDPSLFVTIRKRITEEDINKMSVLMLKKQMQLQEEKRKREEDERLHAIPSEEEEDEVNRTSSENRSNACIDYAESQVRKPKASLRIKKPKRGLKTAKVIHSCDLLISC